MKRLTKVVPYRRKAQGRTDYKRRLKLLQSGQPRFVIRKTNKHMLVQIVVYEPDGDHVILTASSSELPALGWKFATGNMPAAYLTGMLAAKKAKENKIDRAIVDFGLQKILSKSRLYAGVKGAIDFGMDVPCSPDVLPSEDRIMGKHIASHTAGKFKVNPSGIEAGVKDVVSKLKK